MLSFFDIINIYGGDTLIVGVLVEISAKAVDKIFEYNEPKELEKDIKVGIRVLLQ